jgi:hypothetical protein
MEHSTYLKKKENTDTPYIKKWREYNIAVQILPQPILSASIYARFSKRIQMNRFLDIKKT